MAMDWPLTGHARSAMEVLCNPDRSQPAVLRKALAAVRGAGVLRDGEVYDMLGEARAYFEYDESNDRLRVASAVQPVATKTMAIHSLAGAVLAKSKAMELAPPNVQQWYAVRGTQQKRATRVAKKIRAVDSAADKLSGMVGSPAIRAVLIGSVNHTRTDGPHDSFATAEQSLRVRPAQAALLEQEHLPFADSADAAPAEQTTVAVSESLGFRLPVVRMVGAVGLYERGLSLAHRESGQRVPATQQVLLERIDYATVADPEWTNELLGVGLDDVPQGKHHALDVAGAGLFREFLDAGDETVVPLGSTLHAIQRWSVRT